MVYRVEIARNAEAQVEELYLWVVARAPQQGAKWFNGLERAVLSGGIVDREDDAVDVRRPAVVRHADGRVGCRGSLGRLSTGSGEIVHRQRPLETVEPEGFASSHPKGPTPTRRSRIVALSPP